MRPLVAKNSIFVPRKTVYLECFVFKLINYYLRRTSLCSNSKLDFGDFVMTHSVGSTILSGTFETFQNISKYSKNSEFSEMCRLLGFKGEGYS